VWKRTFWRSLTLLLGAVTLLASLATDPLLSVSGRWIGAVTLLTALGAGLGLKVPGAWPHRLLEAVLAVLLSGTCLLQLVFMAAVTLLGAHLTHFLESLTTLGQP